MAPQREGKLPDPISDLLAKDRLPAPYMRIHDEDFGPLWLVQSPRGRAWAEDPDHAGPPVQLVQWLGVFAACSEAVLEVRSFDAATSNSELELAEWLFGDRERSDDQDAPGSRVDPRMRAMLMFQEAQIMGARTSEARTPKYNPLRNLKLQVSPECRSRFRRLRDQYGEIWGDARRQLASALEATGQSSDAYTARLSRIIVEHDLLQLHCVLGQGEAVFTVGASGPHLHPIAGASAIPRDAA